MKTVRWFLLIALTCCHNEAPVERSLALGLIDCKTLEENPPKPANIDDLLSLIGQDVTCTLNDAIAKHGATPAKLSDKCAENEKSTLDRLVFCGSATLTNRPNGTDTAYYTYCEDYMGPCHEIPAANYKYQVYSLQGLGGLQFNYVSSSPARPIGSTKWQWTTILRGNVQGREVFADSYIGGSFSRIPVGTVDHERVVINNTEGHNLQLMMDVEVTIDCVTQSLQMKVTRMTLNGISVFIEFSWEKVVINALTGAIEGGVKGALEKQLPIFFNGFLNAGGQISFINPFGCPVAQCGIKETLGSGQYVFSGQCNAALGTANNLTTFATCEACARPQKLSCSSDGASCAISSSTGEFGQTNPATGDFKALTDCKASCPCSTAVESSSRVVRTYGPGCKKKCAITKRDVCPSRYEPCYEVSSGCAPF